MTSPAHLERGSVPPVAVVLAAGRGTRMRSERPKVLHRVAGRPMLEWVLAAARGAGCERIHVVVGHGAEEVEAAFASPDLVWVRQAEQRGTGHALAQVEGRLEGGGPLLVLSGDVPLVTPGTLRALAAAAAEGWGAMAVAEVEDPGSLGRVEVGPAGELVRIVEAADAGAELLALRRINAGIYALPSPQVFPFLAGLTADNAKGELYLTDALNAAVAAGRRIATLELADPSEGWGINDRRDLARAHRRLLDRRLEELMLAGVTILEPARTAVEGPVEVGTDTVLHPGVSLSGDTRVGRGCVLAAGAWLHDTRLGDGVVVEPYSVLQGAVVGDRCRVGPFARLRPGTVMEAGAKVGNFVEVKASRLGAGVKASHLTYLGDAEVGEGANIGAGVVTCNYDGTDKHPTRIGRRAFIGSDTMLVAPVEVGDDAATGAGSTVSKDVPPGALAVERAPLRILPGWARRLRRRAKE